jgi:hypothetical protein
VPLACVTTDANGNFAFGSSPGCGGALPAGFLCSGGSEQIYVIATGGIPGNGAASANPQIALISVPGQCTAIGNTAVVTINELSTLASVYALSQFIGSGSPYMIGAPPSNAAGLNNALAALGNLIVVASGAVPGPNLPAGGTIPIAKIDTLASALAACVNSAGNQNGSAAPCNELMCDAVPQASYDAADGSCTPQPGVTLPPDTLAATIAIAAHPGAVNVADLCALAGGSSAAFTPTITCNATATPPSPTDWTLALNFTAGGLLTPRGIAIDGAGDILIANEYSPEGTGSVTEYGPAGALLSDATGLIEPSYDHPVAIAIDPSANVWIVNAIANSVSEDDFSANPVLDNVYIGGGLDEPVAIALDAAGDAWIANDETSGSVSEFDSSGNPVSPVTGYSVGGLVSPRDLAIDGAGDVWVINTPYTGSSANVSDLAELDDKGNLLSPSGGYAGGGLFASTALAIDGTGNIWVSNQFGGLNATGSISAFHPNGTPITSSTGYTGGGIYGPAGMAIDGADNVWIANSLTSGGLGNSISELTSNGLAVSPFSGYTGGGMNGPLALAIDSAGNLWVINNSGNSVTEFIGIATPVKTPLLGLPTMP